MGGQVTSGHGVGGGGVVGQVTSGQVGQFGIGHDGSVLPTNV